MIRLKPLTVHTRYTPGTYVFFVTVVDDTLTIRQGTIGKVEFTFWDDCSVDVTKIGVRESTTLRWFGNLTADDVFLSPAAAARYVADYNMQLDED